VSTHDDAEIDLDLALPPTALLKHPSTMPAQKFTLVLPMAYAPYIVKTTDSQSLQKIVEGDLSTWGWVTENNRVQIHPMFMREDSRWAFADRALELAQLKNNGKMYVNDCGMYMCCVNMATINPKGFATTGCPHVFGNVVIVLNEKQLLKINEQWREIVKIYETNDERWDNVTDDEEEEEEEDD
jgi:hypothetical protein